MLLVADSFRVREREGVAEARMPAMHFDRFRRGVAAAIEGLLDGSRREEWWRLVFEPFMETGPGRIADGGAGFPRIELRGIEPLGNDGSAGGDPVLDVLIRPLPPLTTDLELRSAPGVRLATPRLKGPNIDRLGALNRELGAEALLLDEAGRAVEGATTSLVWWDGPVLCTARSRERVESVTERLVLAIAERRGVPLEPRACTPDEIASHEVWALNALHGIRAVTLIDGTPTGGPERGRIADFRDGLESAWRPLNGG